MKLSSSGPSVLVVGDGVGGGGVKGGNREENPTATPLLNTADTRTALRPRI